MINTAIEIFGTVVDVLLLIWFVPKFNEASLIKHPYSLVWALLLLVFQLTADSFLQGFDLLYALIDFLIVVCFALSLGNKKKLWSLFSAFLYVILVMLFNTLVFALFSIILSDVSIVIQGEETDALPRFLYIVTCKLGHFALYGLLLQIFKKNRTLDWFSAILAFFFTVSTAVGLGMVIKLAEINRSVGTDYPILLLSVILIMLNVILYLMIWQVQNLMRSKYELRLMQERMVAEKARIDEATYIWENIKKVRHDLKNHFTVIRGKLDEGDAEACKQYLANLYQTVDHMGDLIQSGNSVIDYLINSKLSGLSNVQVLIFGYVGNYSDIEEVDLACILGNILDNAVEAQNYVSGEKRIELHFLQKNSNRIILCKNTIETSVLENNKALKTTKETMGAHGLGHRIVADKVQKYHGILDYFEEDSMFGVQIVLP